MGRPAKNGTVGKYATYCFSNIRKFPLGKSADTKCPQAAQRKQAKRACFYYFSLYFLLGGTALRCFFSSNYKIKLVIDI